MLGYIAVKPVDDERKCGGDVEENLLKPLIDDDFEAGKYWCDNDCRIYRRKKTGIMRAMKSSKDKDGYKQIGLTKKDGTQKRFFNHRLGLEILTGRKIRKGYEVDHVDRDVTNNNIANLEEVTKWENNARSSRARVQVLGKVVGTDTWQLYDSGRAAARDTDCHLQSIQHVTKGHRKRTRSKVTGKYWTFKRVDDVL